jgi:phenylalanyl-tRNA synthetase beta chain
MKFSYSLIKKIVAGLPPIKEVGREINLKAFEVEEISGGVMDIKIPANRWADAASHWGIAKEAGAIFNKKIGFKIPKLINIPENKGRFKVKVREPVLCPRYFASYLELPKKIGQSPVWMRKVLRDCGLRPINAAVDIMNYVMLEVGQPLHAFDAAKIKKGIIVRRAKKGEKMTTIDGVKINLEEKDLVIADEEKPLALAGIKGGKGSEIDGRTKTIIVEAANFEAGGIYRTSRRLNLFTDASSRFGHGQSPELVEAGINRAIVLLRDICGAKLVDSVDIYPKKQARKLLKFDLLRFNGLTGLNLDGKTVLGLLKKLGFSLSKEGLIEIPALRLDINIFEDLAEEAARMYGFENVKIIPPTVSLIPPEIDEIAIMKDKIRNAVVPLGFDEVYNYSFSREEKGAVALENPISRDKAALRISLVPGLLKNIEDNLRFFEDVRIFEIGKAFFPSGEGWRLGLAIHLKKEISLRELKGAVESLLRGTGLTDYLFVPEGKRVRVESDHRVLGYIDVFGKASVAELNVERLTELAEGEAEYLPLSAYPAVERDISLYLPENRRVEEVLAVIDEANIRDLADVDMVDYLMKDELGTDVFALTFRLVFQSDSRTLSDEEVNRETAKIIEVLRGKLGLTIR